MSVDAFSIVKTCFDNKALKKSGKADRLWILAFRETEPH